MKTLASAGGTRSKLVVNLDTYEGMSTVDIRKYYLDRKTKEYRPTRKGITLTRYTYVALRNVLDEFDEEISNWLSTSAMAAEVRHEQKQNADSAQRARFQPKRHKRRTAERKSPVFFESVAEGGLDTIVYNSRHRFVQRLESLIDELERGIQEDRKKNYCEELRNMIDIMLLGFCRARYLYDNSPVIAPDILFDDLLFNWGQMLQNYSKEVIEN